MQEFLSQFQQARSGNDAAAAAATAAAAVAAAAAAVASPRTPGGDDEAAGVGGRIGDNTTLLFLRPVVFLLVKAITLPRQARDKENT
jgi:hypothetical protein